MTTNKKLMDAMAQAKMTPIMVFEAAMLDLNFDDECVIEAVDATNSAHKSVSDRIHAESVCEKWMESDPKSAMKVIKKRIVARGKHQAAMTAPLTESELGM